MIDRSIVHRAGTAGRLIPALVALVMMLAGIVRADGPPNIVLVVVDDLGWRDAGCMGSDFHRTPAIDRLAAEGQVFTSAYANGANCAPSRAAIMSGQYAPRTGIYTVGQSARGRAEHRRLAVPPNRTVLDAEVDTLAEVLHCASYRTAAVGKWHLGDGPSHGPLGQGFEVNVAGNQAGHPRSYLSPYGNRDLPDGPPGEHLTARLTDEAIRFIEHDDGRPFFLYLSYYAVHTPLQPRHDLLEACRARPRGSLHRDPRYAAMVEGVDEGLGRLLEALDERDLADRTLVVFTSDNGGHGSHTSMRPLRGSKGMIQEGGIRVPLIARWPGRIAPGRSDVPVIGLDLYPTLIAAAGAELSAGQPVDGVNLLPMWTGGDPPAARSLFWHMPAYLQAWPELGAGRWRATPCSAVRTGNLKLIEFLEDGHLELYDLAEDPGEAIDLSATRPDTTRRLHEELITWRRSMDAPVPSAPNPQYETDAPSAASEPGSDEQRDRESGDDGHEQVSPPASAPNIIVIFADDLGYGELGCYGQERIATPSLDRMADQGLRFTRHYAGSAVCAPSRCVLMTGQHTGHAFIRNNRGRPVVGQEPIPDTVVTMAERLKDAGYATGCIGKWGLGGPETTGLPNRQGFDHWFGYLDQWNAHSHYPPYLWRNDRRIDLAGNDGGARAQYAQDLFADEAMAFIRRHATGSPFFLYLAPTIPHVSLHAPGASVAEYAGRWPETPFDGGHYDGHATPRAAYAAMISHLDRDVGAILDLLAELAIDERTLVLFTSDNGPAGNGGADPAFFGSTGGLRGIKGSLLEGGIRVPLIARWPGRVPAGQVSDHVSAGWDLLPTVMELAGAAMPGGIDGISMTASLLGRPEAQEAPRLLYWELGRQQAILAGSWKLLRRTDRQGATTAMLFNLEQDPGEARDVAGEHPDVVKRMVGMARAARTPSTVFPSVYDDGR